MIQVLGAISYGEWRAYEGARAKAETVTDDAEKLAWRTIAAQELRHYKGFTARLEAMGADPDEAMAEFRPTLDTYNTNQPGNAVEDAVWSFLGEGIADDLMVWFRDVVDDDLRAFVETVLADEAEHEDHAAVELRAILASDPANLELARGAAQSMVDNMLSSGGPTSSPVLAFLQLGRADELIKTIVGGFARRLDEIGIDPRAITMTSGV